MLGHQPVGAVEIDPFCRRVLQARQDDGSLPRFPIHDDIRTFDATTWQGRVDVVAGGFPCQDISLANHKATGLAGARSSLWHEMLRVVRECQPRYVFVENSPALRTRGLGTVLRGLADLGFDAEWGVLSAQAVGAPHIRKRLWLLAADPDTRQPRRDALRLRAPSNSDRAGLAEREGQRSDAREELPPSVGTDRRTPEPGLDRASHGVAAW